MHPSYIFRALLVAFLLATLLAISFNWSFALGIYIIMAALISVVAFWRQKPIRYLLLAIIFVVLAVWRVGEMRPRSQIIYGEKVSVIGMIVEEPKAQTKSQQIIIETEKGNRFQLNTAQFPTYNLGESVSAVGIMRDPAVEDSKYQGLYRVRGIVGIISYPAIEKSSTPSKRNYYILLRARLVNFRKGMEENISRAMPEPAAGLASGILLGTKTDISTELMSALSRTGTVHIIALSGYNITIIAGFFMLATKRFSRRWSFWLPTIGIILFVLATGLSASVVRAAIMGILLLIAGASGRQPHALTAILFASFLMVLANPYILIYDIGFQLSFAAVCGILLLAPKLSGAFSFLGPVLGPIAAATISAQLFSWPIVTYYFQIFSVVAPVANLLILPTLPFVMSITFIIGACGFVSTWFAQGVGLVGWIILSAMIKIISFLSNLKFSAIAYQINSKLILIGYYFLLGDLLLILRRKNGRKT